MKKGKSQIQKKLEHYIENSTLLTNVVVIVEIICIKSTIYIYILICKDYKLKTFRKYEEYDDSIRPCII